MDLLVKKVLGGQVMLIIKASWCHLIGCALFVVASILHDEHPAFRFVPSVSFLLIGVT